MDACMHAWPDMNFQVVYLHTDLCICVDIHTYEHTYIHTDLLTHFNIYMHILQHVYTYTCT